MSLVLFKLVNGKAERSLHDVMSLDDRLSEGYKKSPEDCETKPKAKPKDKAKSKAKAKGADNEN